jgi:hypothetical protein
MEPEREFALEKSAASLAYFDVLREALDDAERRARSVCAGLEAGASLAETFEAVDASTGRKRLTDTFAEFERLRHDARLALMLLAAGEGMNKSAIARAWGISPQWAGHEVEAARRTVGAGPEPGL